MRKFIRYVLCILVIGTFSQVFAHSQKNLSTSEIKPGVTYSHDQSTFAIWSPDTSNVQLWLDGNVYSMQKQANNSDYTDLYAVTVPDDWNLKSYHFLINGQAVRDPYAVMTDVRQGLDANYENDTVVIDLSQTMQDKDFVKPPAFNHRTDAIIYETSVRDFTIDRNTSGVSSNLQGKFLGLVQSGTTYQGYKTGIDHLKEMGVTHVQLMPFYSFGTCSRADVKANPGCYNWGYDPIAYNAPEYRFSQYEPSDEDEQKLLDNPHYVDRIKELQQTINEFHQAGIRVIMDVVYNHTYDKNVFGPITSQYYTSLDLSGCGNSIDASNPMVNRMILDSLEYWVKEYHVDGFRFDLVGVFDYKTVGDWARQLNQDFPDRNLLIYGEPWNGGVADPQEPNRVRLGTEARMELDDSGRENPAHVAIFNPEYRNAIKGGRDDDSGGYIVNQLGTQGLLPIYQGVRGASRAIHDPTTVIGIWDPQFANNPEEDINYVSCHDDLTLWDKINLWAKDHGRAGDMAYLKRADKFAMGIVLTSEGIAFIHSGSEMLRTKNGIANSYNAPDSVNEIRWNGLADNSDVYNFYKNAIKIRKKHIAFRMTAWDDINNNLTFEYPSYNTIAIHINGQAVSDAWKNIIVIYNSAGDFNYTLPTTALGNTWHIAMEDDVAYDIDQSTPTATGALDVKGTAVTVLYQE